MSDGYTLAVKVYHYADGSASGSAMLRREGWRVGSDAHAPGTDRTRRGGAEPSDAAREAMERLNRRRSARRSRQLLVRHVRTQGMDCLGTLTFGGSSLPSAYDALNLASEWYLSEGRALLGGSRAVMVPEHGERNGRVHVHLGLVRHGQRWDYSALIRSWSAFLAARGYASGAASGLHRVHFSKPIPARRLSKYLAKYLGKSIEEVEVPKGCHRYRNHGCAATEPVWVAAIDCVEGLMGALGLSARELYAYKVTADNGDTFLVGFGFDTGG